MSYPNEPGFVFNSDTSEAAADSINANSLRAKVHKYIQASLFGATCDEVEVALNLRHQTASARIRELALKNHVRDTGHRRVTRSRRNARVYVAI